ncbi:uncharacterized protein LOC106050213 isoform X1 [Biomphalaria glabrata]|uniref:Uncharacterized protein LOC106050213 isoform X1 n=2 Tax=Biomphalaria glabrata TaxID=6526 RepID=A0A9W3ADS9_BIOGL|nr:uncharacterized protein LOC106050213 isoform X1 [Biomphalaria glabrata]KAI8773695.1 hypothetical protein BgiBS90_024880 [Biomphalaria glabrata]
MLKNNAVAALQKPKRYKTSRTNTLSISAIFRIAISSVNAHRGLELRCYKFSPRVHDVNKTKTSVQLYDYEAKVWKETFESMGRLKELHLKEATPFTTLNKAPYHCSALSRDYKVAYGKMSQVEGASVKGTFKPKKEVKVSYCNCIFSSHLPKYNEPTSFTSVPRRLIKQENRVLKPYLPKSSVMVKYNRNMYDTESICEWLQRFGLLVFTIRKGENTLIVTFETMTAAYDAVNKPMPFSRIVITWLEPRMYNYGHYCAFKLYTVTTDNTWNKLINQIVKKEKSILKASHPGSRKTLKFDT